MTAKSNNWHKNELDKEIFDEITLFWIVVRFD